MPAADFTLRIGIDPTGDADANSPSVIWSARRSQPADFADFTITAPAAGGSATVFLHATQNDKNIPTTAVWDAVELIGWRPPERQASKAPLPTNPHWLFPKAGPPTTMIAPTRPLTAVMFTPSTPPGRLRWRLILVNPGRHVAENRDSSGAISGAIAANRLSPSSQPLPIRPSASFVFHLRDW